MVAIYGIGDLKANVAISDLVYNMPEEKANVKLTIRVRYGEVKV